MALPLVIQNCIQVRLLFVLAGQLGVNVLHGTVTGGVVVNQALANTLGSAIKSAWSSNLGAHCPPSTALVRVGVRDLRSANLTEFLDTGAAVGGIATAVDALPAQNAAVVTLRTALSGKSFRGRVYISGFSEAENDVNGNTATAANTAAVAFIAAVQGAMTTSLITLAVASRPAERKTLVETTFHADGTSTARTLSTTTAKAGGAQNVTSVAARDANWQSQRRRSNGRGAPPTLLADIASHTF